jgi:hypothetical protein
MAWVENDCVQIFKTMDFNIFTEKYLEVILRCGNINMLIHFRITSRGVTNEEMCHPFMVGDNMAIIHNGTISNIKADETKNGDSDTKVLAEQILANLPEGWESNAATHRLLEEFIGWSKICILTDEDKVYILNESSGFWAEDIWYSNRSYVSYTRTVYTPPVNNTLPALYDRNQHFQSHNSQNFWEEFCDTCFQEFKRADLTPHLGTLLCPSCLLAAERDLASKSTFAAQGATIHRPCAGCRTLVDRDEMWHLELEFMKPMDEHPEQLDCFQSMLITPHATFTDVGTGYFCETCYMSLMSEERPDALLSLSILDYPDMYTEEEIAVYEATLGVGCTRVQHRSSLQ